VGKERTPKKFDIAHCDILLLDRFTVGVMKKRGIETNTLKQSDFKKKCNRSTILRRGKKKDAEDLIGGAHSERDTFF